MKKVLAVVLVICGVIISSVFIGGYLSKNDKETTSNPANSQTADSGNSSTDTNSQGEGTGKTFSLADVKQHASKDDCWIIVSGNVYDVTKYTSSHPGGANEIIRNCGKDATTDFKTQGGEGSHSSSAEATLKTFLIGTVQ